MKVALIGRPNVGKSTLFNILTRTRKAVVKNQPGVTRDILLEKTEWWGSEFEVVDTGGLTEASDTFSQLIREQVLSIMKTFDALVVVMDGRVGLIPEDRDIIRIASESGLPFVVAVNKLDTQSEQDVKMAEFYEFNCDLLPCSFERRDGVDSVVEWIIKHKPEVKEDKADRIKIAIVGKPNVGKSSLVNYLLGHKRVLVSDIAGTTVDSVETPFSFEGVDYTLVDTAGLRRKSKRKDGIEILSAFKSEESIRRADIVLLMIDGTDGVSDLDANLVDKILDSHKPVILVANKLDLGKQDIPEFRKWFRAEVEKTFHFFPDIPITFCSAKTGAGIDRLFDEIQDIWGKLGLRITTSKLNDFFYRVIRQAPAPVWGTTNVKFYYLTQTHQKPPSFIAFANHPQGVTPAYRRFLTKRIKLNWDLQGIPVRLFVMKSGGK